MRAEEILHALRAHKSRAAIVPEVTLTDHDYLADPDVNLGGKATRRIDALMFETLQRTAIEIKVSTQDYARDDWQKRRPWARVVHRFVYLVPADLDVRPYYGCGLWRVHPNGRVEIARKAKVNPTPEPLPQQVVQALAYRAMAARLSDTEETGR